MKRQSFLLSGAGAMLAGCAGSVVPSGSPSAAGSQPATHGNTKKQEEGYQLLGSLLLVPYGYAPAEFVECDGALMKIENKTNALFSLLWTKFGGDGRTNFALPDMRGRGPIKGLMYVIATEGVFPSRKFRLPNGGVAPLLGQLLLVPYVPMFIPPPGWAVSDGKVLDIRGNQELFSVIGNKFGGNGQTNFALPDLRGHEPHKDVTYLIALKGRFPVRG
jgi:microcystin-dependent protein